MRRVLLFTLTIFGISSATLGQSASSDNQTLQAILTEVRALRQDLRVSQARTQNSQILLYRLQIEQASVARSSEHLDDARSKLVAMQGHEKAAATALKRLEDELTSEQNLQQQKLLQDRINPIKSDLESDRDTEQEYRAQEIQAEQQLRAEQDKLTALEARLDELTRSLEKSTGRSDPDRP